MALSKEDIQNIVDVVNTNSMLSHEDHSHHHEFIEAMVKKEERKQETWQKVKVQVLGWGVIAVVSSLGIWINNHLDW